jgi:8-oxo-dGTP pyrophosphatase MutT (NUDIX family)
VKQPVSCGFLIVRGNPIESFLLMKHPRRWDLPKGHADEGETELQCALRELQEETGISPADIEVDPVFRFEHSYPVNQKRYGGQGRIDKLLRIFLGRLIRPVDIVVTEHDGHAWLPWKPPHRIQELTIDPLLKQLEAHLSRLPR